jgi:hypothetical protein
VLRALLVPVALMALAGCDAMNPSAAETPQPIVLRSAANGFVLETTLPRLTWRSDEAIQVATTLTYAGPDARTSVWGSGSGVVEFQLQELTGNRSVGAPMTADCHQWDYVRNVPLSIPYPKGAGWSEDDPNALFYKAYTADPLLHLPPGRWRITIDTVGSLLPCDRNAPSLGLKLPPIELEVR